MKDKLQLDRWKWRWLAVGLAFAFGLLLVLFAGAASAADEPSELALLAGRFHPVLVHLPIGLLLAAGLLEGLSRFRRFAHLKGATLFVLVLGAASAVVAAAAGLLLAREGGYDAALLYWHQRLGLGVAAAAVLACLLKVGTLRSPSALLHRSYAAVLAGVVGLLTVAGHLGGSLTHGSDYLTRYMPGPLKGLSGPSSRASLAPAQFASIKEVVIYADLIQPILDARCVACHNPDKRRGRLLLDTPEGLLQGGEGGPVLVAGRSEESELVRRIMLPPEHEDHMPPDGRAPLTPVQAELIRWWIDEGARFDQTVAEARVPRTVRPVLDWLSVPAEQEGLLALDVPPPDPEAVQALKAQGFLVMPLAAETSLLQVQNTGAAASFGDEQMQALLPLAQQITWLDLGGTDVGDAGLATLQQLQNLTRLHLERTRVTDAGLAQLTSLPHLRYLNLYGTAVSDSGLVHLAALPDLQALYLWQTRVTEQGVQRLQQQLPGLEVNLGGRLEPVEEAPPAEAASY